MTIDNNREEEIKRFDFIDQFRGLAIVFLVIAIIVSPMRLFPPLLNHGIEYYNPGLELWNWSQMRSQFYTVIDLGLSYFALLMGVSIGLQFKRIKDNIEKKLLFKKYIFRIIVFIVYDFFFTLFDLGFNQFPSYRGFLFDHTLPLLGWSALLCLLSLYLIKSVKKRFLLSLFLITIHGILYAIPVLDIFKDGSPGIFWMGVGTFFDFFIIPWRLISIYAITLAGTCFIEMLDTSTPINSFKKFHLPIASSLLMICFVSMFFIPLNNRDLSASQDLLAISTGYFLIIIFYSFNTVFQFKIPYLSAMGRNSIFLYLFQLIPLSIFRIMGLYDLITPEYSWFALILLSVSILITIDIGYLLDKHRLYFRI